MTDEELLLELKNVSESINRLGPENKLSTRDWRILQKLKREQQLLEGIRKARENKNISLEVKMSAEYQMLKEEKSMHPILSYLLKIRFRSHIWG